MLNVYFDPNKGIAVADGKLEEYALGQFKESLKWSYCPHTIQVSNATTVDMFRCLINQGKIDHSQIRFYFGGNQIEFNEKGWFTGNFDDYPKELLISETLLRELE